MKTIQKFKINPQKIIDNEELVNLRGGYDSGCCWCNIVFYSGESLSLEACDNYSDCRDAEQDLWAIHGGAAISIACE